MVPPDSISYPVTRLVVTELGYVHLVNGEPLPPLSLPSFRAILVIEDAASDAWRDDVAKWLVDAGCLYCCTWGKDCEAWHDSVDLASIDAFGAGPIPDDHLVITTWHDREPLSDALSFVAAAAGHPTVELAYTLVVHVAQYECSAELLERYRRAISA